MSTLYIQLAKMQYYFTLCKKYVLCTKRKFVFWTYCVCCKGIYRCVIFTWNQKHLVGAGDGLYGNDMYALCTILLFILLQTHQDTNGRSGQHRPEPLVGAARHIRTVSKRILFETVKNVYKVRPKTVPESPAILLGRFIFGGNVLGHSVL